MADEDVNVSFGAAIGALTSAVTGVSNQIKEFATQAKEHVDGVAESFGKLQEIMLGIAAIAAGGAMFKEMINSTLEATEGVTKLQKSFGLSLEDANKTRSSLELLGISTDDYTQMATRLDRQLRAGSDSLTKLGITAKDLNLGQGGLMEKAISLLGQYKEGVDRNIAAQTMFGRGSDAAMKLVQLGLDGVKEKAVELEEKLGLTITEKDQADARQYRIAMNELSMAFAGIQKAIGSAVLPYLTAFANWFAEIAPTIIQTMKSNMAAIVEAAFNAAGGFIAFVTRVVGGVYNLFVLWEYIQTKLGNTSIADATASIDKFEGALKNLEQFKDNALKVINDLKTKVLAAKPFESLDFGVPGKGTKSATGILDATDKDAVSAAMKTVDGQIKVLQQGLAQKKLIYDGDVTNFKMTEDQKYAALENATQKEYGAELALLQKELQIDGLKVAQRQAILNKISELEQKHRTDMIQLDQQSVAARVKLLETYTNAVQTAFNSQLRGLLAGTTSFMQAAKSMLGDLIIFAIENFEKMGIQWLVQQLAMTTATQTGAAARASAEAAGNATGSAQSYAEAVASVLRSSVQTFAGVFANLAPALGPAAAGPAAAAQATVAASVGELAPPLATGAWNISKNTLAMLHPDELVAPAPIAPFVRDFLSGGSGGGDTFHLGPIQALDAASVANLFKKNSSSLVAALQGAIRNRAP
jgi:hypothetical protein